MNKTSVTGSAMLFFAALIWGLAFVAQRNAVDMIDSVSLNVIRYSFAAVFLGVVVLVLDLVNKKRGKRITPFNRDTLIGGTICGFVLMVASMSQQIGLETTTAGKSGFITALYIVFVPVIGLLARRKTPTLGWFAIVIAIAGFWMISVGDDFSVTIGDLITLCCAVVFSFHILFIDVYIGKCDPIKFSFVQFVAATLFGLPLMAFNGFPSPSVVGNAMLTLLYMGVCSGGIAYTFQVAGQKKVKPAIATLIMSLESVFALLGGAIILHEANSAKEIAGCLLVFVAVFLAQFELPRRFLKYEKQGFFS